MKTVYRDYFKTNDDTKLTDKVFYTRIISSVAIIIFCMLAMSLAAYAFFSASVESTGNLIKTTTFETKIAIINETSTTRMVEISDTEDDASSDESNDADASQTLDGVESSGDSVKYMQITDVVRKNLLVEKSGEHSDSVTLEKGKNIFTIKRANADESAETGFCIIYIENCDVIFFTQQIGIDKTANNQEDSITFTLELPATAQAYIISHWGTSSHYGYVSASPLSIDESNNSNEYYILDGETVEVPLTVIPEDEPKFDNSYIDDYGPSASTDTSNDEPIASITIEVGDRLVNIATEYNTTVEILMAYNGIEDADNILIGQVINIPPTTWTIPETTDTETTDTETTDTETTDTETTDTETTDTETTDTETTDTETTDTKTTNTETTDTETTDTETTDTETTDTETTDTDAADTQSPAAEATDSTSASDDTSASDITASTDDGNNGDTASSDTAEINTPPSDNTASADTSIENTANASSTESSVNDPESI